LAISGSNLNNEAKANWDNFFVQNPNAWSFEGSSPSADGYGALGPNGGAYDSTVSILGSRSMKFQAQGTSTSLYDQHADYNAINPAGGDANDYWVRAYVRWNLKSGGWPSSHIKMMDIQGSGPQYYLQPQADASGNMPTSMVAVHDGVSSYNGIPSGPVENNRWYAVEVHWKTDSAPYVYDLWIDGVKTYSANPKARGSMNYMLFGLINACCTNSSFSLDHWFDGLAVARSRIYPSAIVEVGNSSNYATATKRTQALEKISDGQIISKLDLTGLGAGPYYLWVTNNRQERSQPYLLIQGGGIILSSPFNLRIQ
jgi:hypothetical protein